ncbi:triokinase/FMN cyclase-like isoform X2 [Actinia tenebrosa]|uniref:Triokinase/FMN cyclase n=1 Tax=Actinia tenebrosa TaxID=6105 RepID=A0A6P8IYK1_ACTTE|nr:triokinase/FMN cyclase-like isoform X2 [Actinia tenebrosa]
MNRVITQFQSFLFPRRWWGKQIICQPSAQKKSNTSNMANVASQYSSKKLINRPENAVDEALEGIVTANPGLSLLKGHRVIIRNDVEDLRKAGKVTLVSGGGSGHEPSHAGFVGKGMLTAAVAGAVFTSPPTKSILAAIRAVGTKNKGGTLLIVKNYTGDRLNFGFAAERAKAEGLKVEMVVVGEDCALTTKDKSAGRRGLCGTLLIHKIAGSLAEEGKSLEEIVSVAKAAAQSMGTMSVSLSPCTIPGSGPSFSLAEDEIELGLGIHGEPGVKRIKIQPVDSIVKTMIEHMTNTKEDAIHKMTLHKGDHVALVINNLGGTSYLEMNIVARATIQYLVSTRGVAVDRVYCGTLMTSIEMAGVSVTLLHLDKTRTHCLDSETTAPSWPRASISAATGFLRHDKKPLEFDIMKDDDSAKKKHTTEKLNAEGQCVFNILSKVTDAIISAEGKLNELDNISGDGDCGSTLKRGADGIKKALGSKDSPGLACYHIHETLLAIANVVEDSMGGSSGVFYSLLLVGVASALKTDTSLQSWSKGLEAAVQSIMRYGGAEPGDRTMIDALNPASVVLKQQQSKETKLLDALELAVKAAEDGAQATAHMQARAGRSSYVSAEHLKNPDPGAVAVATWMRAAYDGLICAL